MGISFNPSIVRSGLICHLDAANIKSYNPAENLLLQSEAVTTSPWGYYAGNGGNTVTVDQIPGPFGGASTADLVAQSGSVNSILQGVTIGGTITLTASVYVKSVTATSLTLTLWRITGGASQSASVGFDPMAGKVVSSGGTGFVQASCTPVGNGWCRIQITTTGTDALNTTAQFELYNYTGGATSYYVWGAQLERSIGATAYTATTTSQVTRGTTWTDLTGNGNHGVLTNFPIYRVDPNGFKFNGTNQSVTISSLNLSTGPWSIIGMARYDGLGQAGRMLGALNNNWLVGHWNGSTANFYSEGWVTSVANGGYNTLWGVHAATGDTVTKNFQYYKNGKYVAANGNGFAGPNVPQLGAGSSEYGSGEVSAYLVYNRILSLTEITQASVALMGRGGVLA